MSLASMGTQLGAMAATKVAGQKTPPKAPMGPFPGAIATSYACAAAGASGGAGGDGSASVEATGAPSGAGGSGGSGSAPATSDSTGSNVGSEGRSDAGALHSDDAVEDAAANKAKQITDPSALESKVKGTKADVDALEPKANGARQQIGAIDDALESGRAQHVEALAAQKGRPLTPSEIAQAHREYGRSAEGMLLDQDRRQQQRIIDTFDAKRAEYDDLAERLGKTSKAHKGVIAGAAGLDGLTLYARDRERAALAAAGRKREAWAHTGYALGEFTAAVVTAPAKKLGILGSLAVEQAMAEAGQAAFDWSFPYVNAGAERIKKTFPWLRRRRR